MVLYFYGTRPEKNQTLNASLRMTLSHILMFDSTRERLPGQYQLNDHEN
jgi:hypothetical protein